MTVPTLDGLDLPHLRAMMLAVDAELTAGGAGGRLAAESLANVLAVQLIRYVLAPRRLRRGRDGALPQGRLRAVVAYIEEHLGASPTLDQMAAVARLSPYHFARQFKAATGLPPHQYFIVRRVERAKQILQGGDDFSLAQVAVRPASRTRASSRITSSAWSASTRDSSGRPQESPKWPQVPPIKRPAKLLTFLMSRVGRRGRADGEDR